MKHLDLSHTIRDGLITYKGLPAPIVCDYLSRADSRAHYSGDTSFHIGKIEMVANTGTYIDSPFHRFEDGCDIASLELHALAGVDGAFVNAVDPPKRAIDRSTFASVNVSGRAVLVHTGWSRHWGTDRYFEGHPFLTRDAAEYLRDGGAALVGIDSYNIDDTGDGTRPAHTILLRAGIPIVEHMCNLDALPPNGFAFTAVPPKIEGMGTFPVRAFATLP